jgi:dTDP-glucose pyrophosphorylase
VSDVDVTSLGEGSSLRRDKSKRPRLQHVWRHAFNPTQAEPTPSGGLKIACLEEISCVKGWIDAAQLEKNASLMRKNPYGQYLMKLIANSI